MAARGGRAGGSLPTHPRAPGQAQELLPFASSSASETAGSNNPGYPLPGPAGGGVPIAGRRTASSAAVAIPMASSRANSSFGRRSSLTARAPNHHRRRRHSSDASDDGILSTTGLPGGPPLFPELQRQPSRDGASLLNLSFPGSPMGRNTFLVHSYSSLGQGSPGGIPSRSRQQSNRSWTSLIGSDLAGTAGSPPRPHSERSPLIPPTGQDGAGAPDFGSTESGATKADTAAAGGPFWRQPGFRDELVRSVVFGLINSIIILPVTVSYAQIIFSHHFFRPYMPYLVKLVFASSIIHQLCFTLKSNLPFAIGQVQDAGLIFLSGMATSIVTLTTDRNATPDETLATVLCWLALSTAMLGVSLWLTGKLHLASLVQFLPMPVVGGYLAYIGLYCLQAALAIMSGVALETIADWRHLADRDTFILMSPGLVFAVILFLVSRSNAHFAVLPALLVAVPVLFWVILEGTGTSLTAARAAHGHGWVGPAAEQTHFYEVWDHFQFAKIQWYAIAPQIPKWLAMYFVVAFSSCLDVAAIQMDLGRPLDFNHELKVVGISNLCSGLAGGFTGSYIFSQTVFTMRGGITSRINGGIIIACCLAIFCAPISILSFTPTLFFGAILAFIGFDLMYDWLWHARTMVNRMEYAVVWLTLIAIVGLNNLEYGFLAGVGISLLLFVFKYSISPATEQVYKRSNVFRGFGQRMRLSDHYNHIAILELHGFVFFGSAVKMLRDVEHCVFVEAPEEAEEFVAVGLDLNGDTTCSILAGDETTLLRLSELHDLKLRHKRKGNLTRSLYPTRYLVLDFSAVTGLDATAARTCFVTLKQTLQQHGISLVLCGMKADVLDILTAHGVLSEHHDSPTSDAATHTFENLDLALAWCEDRELDASFGAQKRGLALKSTGISGIIESYLVRSPFQTAISEADILPFFDRVVMQEGECLYQQRDDADAIFFVESGEVTVAGHASPTTYGRPGGNFKGLNELRVYDNRIASIGPGGVVGELTTYLDQSRWFQAVCKTETVVYKLSLPALMRMQEEQPHIGMSVQHAILRSAMLFMANNLSNTVTAQ